METQLVFQSEYRWDLKKVESVLIPYVFDDDPSLIITVSSKSKLFKNYQTCGRLDEILIDYPNKLVASSQVVRLEKNFQYLLSGQGRFQLLFYPYQFMGKTQIAVRRIL
ncbi:hypothetical protein H6G68_12855 [Anabaena catenula FACHB-362]|uniref:Uncharacterized protein n=1 Tax=Anabaena catenula FACHB-362 TaxID=2692877 RepID=A0ABR8J3B7_9NOST|nr:hypothetical protein [Anabaena catenula FACHB-362]